MKKEPFTPGELQKIKIEYSEHFVKAGLNVEEMLQELRESGKVALISIDDKAGWQFFEIKALKS